MHVYLISQAKWAAMYLRDCKTEQPQVAARHFILELITEEVFDMLVYKITRKPDSMRSKFLKLVDKLEKVTFDDATFQVNFSFFF